MYLTEALFYFSGHGQSKDEEFYFALSDFEESRRNTTSLKNTELDVFLRALNPKLAVKIVDACNAGVQYIKDAAKSESGRFQKTTSQGQFNNVYFMFSSLFDQASFCNSHVSDFTKAFLEAIVAHGNAEVRYRDIIDQITDRFETKLDQRPFFITQADHTELFGIFGADAKVRIQDGLVSVGPTTAGGSPAAIAHAQLPLSARLKERAKDYLTGAEAAGALRKIPAIVEEVPRGRDLDELYGVRLTTHTSLSELKNLDVIGRWVEANAGAYFAKPVVSVTRQEFAGFRPYFARDMKEAERPPELIVMEHKWVTGYLPLWDDPDFARVDVDLATEFPNIPSFQIHLLFIHSSRDIRYFIALDSLHGPKRETGDWKFIDGTMRDLAGDAHQLKEIIAMQYTGDRGPA